MMRAAESTELTSEVTITFFFELGADPLAADNHGRTALDHAKMSHTKTVILKLIKKAENEECECPADAS